MQLVAYMEYKLRCARHNWHVWPYYKWLSEGFEAATVPGFWMD